MVIAKTRIEDRTMEEPRTINYWMLHQSHAVNEHPWIPIREKYCRPTDRNPKWRYLTLESIIIRQSYDKYINFVLNKPQKKMKESSSKRQVKDSPQNQAQNTRKMY